MHVQTSYDVVVVGAGVAGLKAAESASAAQPAYRILLVSNEDRVPYKRTKISKNVAAGFQRDQFQIQEPEWYAERRIDVALDAEVSFIDPHRHELRLHGRAEPIRWAKLVIATGASPILPRIAGDTDAVQLVRRATDVERLMAAAAGAAHATVIGMGVLGVEVAEQLVRMGKEVEFVGTSAQLMPKELNQSPADYLASLFRSHGATLRFSEQVHRVERTEEGALLVGLTKRVLNTDLVVCTTGVLPNVETARMAGLRVRAGVVVDRQLRSSHPDVFAAGDVAEHAGGRLTHLWHAAEAQGTIAGTNVAGGAAEYHDPPFRLKCEVFDNYFFSVGKPAPEQESRYEILEGWNADRYDCLYFDARKLAGALMLNNRDQAKAYERGVRERWELERVRSELDLVAKLPLRESSTADPH